MYLHTFSTVSIMFDLYDKQIQLSHKNILVKILGFKVAFN